MAMEEEMNHLIICTVYGLFYSRFFVSPFVFRSSLFFYDCSGLTILGWTELPHLSSTHFYSGGQGNDDYNEAMGEWPCAIKSSLITAIRFLRRGRETVKALIQYVSRKLLYVVVIANKSIHSNGRNKACELSFVFFLFSLCPLDFWCLALATPDVSVTDYEVHTRATHSKGQH